MHCSTSQTPAELWHRLKPGGSEFPRLEVAVLGWCHSGHHWSRCSQPAIPEKKKKIQHRNLCFGISWLFLKRRISRQQSWALYKREIKQEANKAGQDDY